MKTESWNKETKKRGSRLAAPKTTRNTLISMLTKEQIQARTHLVRIHESNCQIEFPTPEEANFRIAIMKQIGREFGLKEIRSSTVAGPVVSATSRAVNPSARTR